MREVAGPHGGAALAEAEIDLDGDLAALEMRGNRRLVVIGQRQAVARGPVPPKPIDRVSRSAGSPALPTAITTRPQLASSPAMAVLTSGELAMARPMRRALSSLSAPVTRNFDELLRPFAVAHDKVGELAADVVPARRRRRRRPGSSNEASGALPALPVAKASTVSLVEVSLSTVMQLKVRVVGAPTGIAAGMPDRPPHR